MTEFMARIFVLCLAVGLQILVSTRGWGMTPQSWWWIIGGGVFGFAFLGGINKAIDKEFGR